ncbi:unnamed protein product [Pseudo-nitzschia multistriata]|uniref:Uncharacterized protein n=1 Tax=Pseudo-nitzschia multistriata TaxID=183589 RepID=A0A448Z786_9STRA|nr:unnamed protein product [Pseudo-nitzschia multistriata]
MSADSQQTTFTRQATILRKNLGEWDMVLHNPRGEDWSKMLGRLNAALSATSTLDNNIEDVMEHFVYLPKRATANPQDIPFFLSTKLDSSATDERMPANSSSRKKKDSTVQDLLAMGDPVQVLSNYEEQAAKLVQEYEEEMVRF